MPRGKRTQLIAAIEKKRNSKVIAYVTSDRPGMAALIAGDVVSLLHEHILALDPKERKTLDLFLYSRGGASDVPWAVVSMFREYCVEGSFSVLLPYRAHSAATLIALGADEIVMTKKAELGPIDITIQTGPYNPTDSKTNQRLPLSVEDVTGYFGLVERVGCERPEEKLQAFDRLASQVHPLALGNVNRLLEQTKLVALRLLETRAGPFPEEENRGIVDHLSSKIYSHSHAIHRTEATNRLGLRQIVKSEDAGIDTDLWDLYKEYRELFSLEEFFLPEQHLIAHGLEEHTWSGLNLACIESAARLDTCRKDLRVRRLRQVPPQVQLNVNIAQVGIPPLPGVAPEQLASLVQQLLNQIMPPIINSAAQQSVNEFLKVLPSAGFELIDLNAGWVQEG